MAHTKQTPRNPKIDRPTAAMGSDVQSGEKSSFKTNIKEDSHERGETASKTFIT